MRRVVGGSCSSIRFRWRRWGCLLRVEELKYSPAAEFEDHLPDAVRLAALDDFKGFEAAEGFASSQCIQVWLSYLTSHDHPASAAAGCRHGCQSIPR